MTRRRFVMEALTAAGALGAAAAWAMSTREAPPPPEAAIPEALRCTASPASNPFPPIASPEIGNLKGKPMPLDGDVAY